MMAQRSKRREETKGAVHRWAQSLLLFRNKDTITENRYDSQPKS
jgi:hypothetical protein